MTVLLLILLAVAMEVTGQLLYKSGIDQVSHGASGTSVAVGPVLRLAWGGLTNLKVLAGLGVYSAQVVVWWVVLSRVDVSYAFPLTSTSYVFLLLGARFFLGEHISVERWLGSSAIMVGVYLITRSAPLPH